MEVGRVFSLWVSLVVESLFSLVLFVIQVIVLLVWGIFFFRFYISWLLLCQVMVVVSVLILYCVDLIGVMIEELVLQVVLMQFVLLSVWLNSVVWELLIIDMIGILFGMVVSFLVWLKRLFDGLIFGNVVCGMLNSVSILLFYLLWCRFSSWVWEVLEQLQQKVFLVVRFYSSQLLMVLR